MKEKKKEKGKRKRKGKKREMERPYTENSGRKVKEEKTCQKSL